MRRRFRFKDEEPLNTISKIRNILLFIATAYYKMNKLPEAYRAMEKFILLNSGLLKAGGRLSYYGCVQDYLHGLSLGWEPVKVIESLSLFYPAEVLGEAAADWREPGGVFKGYGKLNCWSFAGCDFQSHCYYQTIDKLYRAIKDRYARNAVDQERLGALFAKNSG